MTSPDCLERTRSAVTNLLVLSGAGIALSGFLLRWRDQWALFRAPREVGPLLMLMLFGLAMASFLTRRSAMSGDNARFYRRHVIAAAMATLCVPVGFGYGWFVRPQLDAVAPFWVVALTLGFLAFPRSYEIRSPFSPPEEGKPLP